MPKQISVVQNHMEQKMEMKPNLGFRDYVTVGLNHDSLKLYYSIGYRGITEASLFGSKFWNC